MRAIHARDAGLALISTINRWLIAGAIGLAAVFSAFAAHTFRGHTGSLSSAASARSAAVQQSSDDGGGASLQQPAQAPSSASSSAAPVVSGGS